MSEEEKKLYSVKFSGIVRFVGGSFEKFENVDVIRQSDNSIVLLKEKIPDLDLFKISVQYPLQNMLKMETVIDEAKEIE